MDSRLLTAISKPKIQSQAGELVRLALRALDDLKQLDESLYERFVATRSSPHDRAAGEAGLRRLWELTFAGVTPLLVFCQGLAPKRSQSEPGVDPFGGGGWDDLEGGAPVGDDDDLDLGIGDIGDLLEGIDEHVEEGDSEKWARVLKSVVSIEYGLRTQLADAAARVEVALGAGEVNQVLALLDDTQSSASEGVFALITAVYQAFLPDVNPTTMVPGYLTSLARALLVRRGLTDLAATLTPRNDALQAAGARDARSQEQSLAGIRAAMRGFVSSVVCKAMRPADRWQLVELERQLADEPLAAARQTSEGLVKYLDSLASVNQREVLLQHDRRAVEELRESLANARELAEISPRTASEMMDRAQAAAQRLLGRSADIDQLVNELEWYIPDTTNRADTMAFLERLEAVLVAADR